MTKKSSVFSRKQCALNIIKTLRKKSEGMQEPMVFLLNQTFGTDPFLILISCLLSLRAKDTVTLPICLELFQRACTPEQILAIPLNELEKMLRPLGFFRKKARLLHTVSQEILDRFGGKVPDTEEELLSIKGVGRKTANLVLGVGFNKPAICVDTHVHRISNVMGLVNTKTPEQTERALQGILPKKYWTEFNRLLVKWGQNVCNAFCKGCGFHGICITDTKKKAP